MNWTIFGIGVAALVGLFWLSKRHGKLAQQSKTNKDTAEALKKDAKISDSYRNYGIDGARKRMRRKVRKRLP